MKKIIVFLFIVMFLFSCSSKSQTLNDNINQNNQEMGNNELQESSDINENETLIENNTTNYIWVVEPTYTFENVDIVEYNDFLGIDYMGADPSFRENSYPTSVINNIYNLPENNNIAPWINCTDYYMNPYNLKGYFDYGFVEVTQNGKKGIYDYEGNEIISPQKIDIFFDIDNKDNNSNEGAYYAYEEYKWADSEMELIVECYDTSFNYIDNRNFLVMGFGGDFYSLNLSNYHESLKNFDAMFVKESDTAYDVLYLVNNKGLEMRLPNQAVSGIVNGYFRLIRDNMIAFYDINGTQITDYIYENAYDFTDGYAAVKKDGKWGFIDTTGKEVVPCEFEETRPFYDNKAWVKMNGKWGIINISL